MRAGGGGGGGLLSSTVTGAVLGGRGSLLDGSLGDFGEVVWPLAADGKSRGACKWPQTRSFGCDAHGVFPVKEDERVEGRLHGELELLVV